MHVVITGNAGFIGFHTARRLIARGDRVTGVDCVNSYYDPALKEARLAILAREAEEHGADYRFLRVDVSDAAALGEAFEAPVDRVIHLAAQAGVRHSLEHPEQYVQANLVGFANVLEACRSGRVGHLTYASTSSVYGANTKIPFSEHDPADHPLQLYAATKRANELMAHAYSHLFELPTTGLRFFTVYGPWGRPDMALFTFTEAILAGRPIRLFNHGRHTRDFTYVDDIVEGVLRASDHPATPDPQWDSSRPDPASSNAPWRIYNIGNSNPATLEAYVEAIEAAIGRKAEREYLPLQPGDVPDTYADVSALATAFGHHPKMSITEGVSRFVQWYRDYHRV